MNIKFVKSGEKKRILNQLEEQFGISKLNYVLVETGKQKIRGFTGTMTREEMKELAEIANVEIVGIYLIKKENRLRLSLDASEIFGEDIKKNLIELDEEQVLEWMNGKDILVNGESGVYVVKHQNDFLGCCISNGEKLINHVPKERRIRKR